MTVVHYITEDARAQQVFSSYADLSNEFSRLNIWINYTPSHQVT